MNNKYYEKAKEIYASKTYGSNHQSPIIKENKIGNKKVLDLIYHGMTKRMDNVIRNVIPSSYGNRLCYGSVIGYPVVFDNKKGGGDCICYTIMWI